MSGSLLHWNNKGIEVIFRAWTIHGKRSNGMTCMPQIERGHRSWTMIITWTSKCTKLWKLVIIQCCTVLDDIQARIKRGSTDIHKGRDYPPCVQHTASMHPVKCTAVRQPHGGRLVRSEAWMFNPCGHSLTIHVDNPQGSPIGCNQRLDACLDAGRGSQSVTYDTTPHQNCSRDKTTTRFPVAVVPCKI